MLLYKTVSINLFHSYYISLKPHITANIYFTSNRFIKITGTHWKN